MMFLFKLSISRADGGLMASITIVYKLSRVNLPVVIGFKRLNAILKPAGIDIGKEMIGLILTL